MPDDSGEVGLEAAPPPELADAGVAVVDELLMDVLPEVLGLLPVERAPPAELADDPLDEFQMPEVELLGGEVVRGGGEVGHGWRKVVASSLEWRDSSGVLGLNGPRP